MRSNHPGFSLIELMVTIAVAAVLLAVAAPSFNDATLSGKLTSYANNLVASAALARAESIKRNATVTLCVSSNGSSCASSGSWEDGWIVVLSDGTTIIQAQPTAVSGYKITEASSKRSLTFQPTGVGATTATLTVCRATPTVGSQERVVSISATGRASVTRTTTGSCS